MIEAREVLHDDSPDDVHAWQPVATLAAALAIAERTVRARVAAGTVERLTGPGGRSYYRVPPVTPASVAATGSHGSHGNGNAGSRHVATEEALALVVREHQTHVERLAVELGQARATVEQLERVRLAEAEAQAAKRAQLEHELAHVRQLARQIGSAAEEQLAQASATVEHERQRATRLERQADTLREQTTAFVAQARAELAHERQRRAHLEELTRAPWYAVRVKRRLRRELASA